jgi:hypothetical protein
MQRLGIALSLVVAACDGSSRIDDPAEFVALLRAAECEHLVACRVFEDTEQCAARMAFPGLPPSRWPSPPGDASWAAYVAAGTMTYLPEQAAVCIAAMRAPSCSVGHPVAACTRVFWGIAPAGTETSSPAECATGYWSTSSCSFGCCRGVCAQRPAGEPITILLVNGEGEYCGPVPHGVASCENRLACRETVCVRLAAGEPCADNGECPHDMACNGTCAPRREIGQTCVLRGDADTCDHLGAWCDPSNHCAALALEGEPCDLEDQATPVLCQPDLGCDVQTRRCVAVRNLGEPCDVVVPCAAGLHCAVTEEGFVCLPKLAGGERCDEPTDCASGSCSGFTCDPVTTCP